MESIEEPKACLYTKTLLKLADELGLDISCSAIDHQYEGYDWLAYRFPDCGSDWTFCVARRTGSRKIGIWTVPNHCWTFPSSPHSHIERPLYRLL